MNMESKKQPVSRRTFLKSLGLGTATVVAAASVGSVPALGSEAQDAPQAGKRRKKDAKGVTASHVKKIERKGNMTYRTNASTGDLVSLLGFGMMRLPMAQSGVDQKKVDAMVDYAMAHGINYFDTSPHYCRHQSEAATGRALAKYPRESYFLATKMSTFLDRNGGSREAAEAGYEKSFTECGVDYFDYYLIHGVGIGGMPIVRSRLMDIGMLDFLIGEKKKGRIRNLGFSFHGDMEVFNYMMKLHDDGKVRWDMVQIQMNYQDWHHAGGVKAETLYEECRKRGIQNIVMEPHLGGRLASIPDVHAKRLAKARPGDSPAAWGFRFVGSHENILTTLSGMTVLDHVKENVATFSPLVPCTDKEFEMLEDIAAAMVAYPLIGCTACSYCMPCKFGVDIPGNFAAWNKAVNEGKVPPAGKGDPDYESRRKAFAAAFKASVPASDLATACRNCRACLRNCPQRIQIPTHMQRIASLLG